jgi:hypothetical protein
MDINPFDEDITYSPSSSNPEKEQENDWQIRRLKHNIKVFNNPDNREIMKYLLELLDYKLKYGELDND